MEPKSSPEPGHGLTLESFAQAAAMGDQVGFAPGELESYAPPAKWEQWWRGLDVEVDASNEFLRTLDPEDSSLRGFAGLAGERRAALAPPPKHERPRHLRAVPDEDVLLLVTPREYVEALTGEEVPPSGMVRCPFHEDRTPSMKVYEDAPGGWFCFSCATGGSIFDFGAELFGISTRGRDFIELRRRLAAALLGREAA